ncbi:MAG: isopentenyl transferase family protein [Candidatus Daviesbacteria bacterium]|nr:isopentenyl transferase family protein [Candidatus Daviesbacteria bacterium]
MKKLLIILGPTATGKTDLGLVLAKKFNGELIACDSRQVYKDLDIGTGKMPNLGFRVKGKGLRVKTGNGFWEINKIKIWMYDVTDKNQQYSVFDYVKDATIAIEKIHKSSKLPIIVGGTGLYLRGLLLGFPNLGIPINEKLRKQLELLTLQELQEKLKNLSPKKWDSLNQSDQRNPRRLVRAIEISMNKGKGERGKGKVRNFNVLKIGLTAPREVLYKRIDDRIISRINQGMIEEAEDLFKKGLSLKRMRQLGLEYGILADFLDKKINKEELAIILQNSIHRYLKRQLTWFKKEKNVNWFDIAEKNYPRKVEKLISKWYDQFNVA